MGRMQRVFEALSSVTRRKILAYLAHAELNAGEIAARFAMSKPAVSQHLAILQGAGLVASEKRGQHVFYRLCPVIWPTRCMASCRKSARSPVLSRWRAPISHGGGSRPGNSLPRGGRSVQLEDSAAPSGIWRFR
jgi:DNA-binding transcriptional ArsR family regulator